MKPNLIIKSKIERLISIQLTLGVQPEDLANNIYLNDYESISFYKNNDRIIGELVFNENICNHDRLTTLRYIYGEDKKLYRIEEVVNERICIQWDREMTEYELINDIITLLKENYNNYEINMFIKTLPLELKEKIKKDFGVVA